MWGRSSWAYFREAGAWKLLNRVLRIILDPPHRTKLLRTLVRWIGINTLLATPCEGLGFFFAKNVPQRLDPNLPLSGLYLATGVECATTLALIVFLLASACVVIMDLKSVPEKAKRPERGVDFVGSELESSQI